MKEFVLATRSPRRKSLFRNLIDNFLVISPDIDETRQKSESPVQYVERISAKKAQAVRKLVSTSPGKDWVIVAADTIVVDGERILGKPVDKEDALSMLRELRGRIHTVYSGVTVCDCLEGKTQSRIVSSQVLMREYTEDEIRRYVASGDPLDKAGAYAIQNSAFDPAPDFRECFANVMGLPLCHLAVLLKEMGFPGHQDVAERCQGTINYQCPIYVSILSEMRGKESV